MNCLNNISGSLNDVKHVLIFYHVAESVCTHQNDVSLSQTIFINICFYIFFHTDRPCDNILIRVILGFFCFDSSKSYHLFYKRVVFGNLFDLIIDQIQTTVSYI